MEIASEWRSTDETTVLITAARYVTVLVADIRDFTRLAGDELDRAGAATQKYIGDAVMGVGTTDPHPPRAENVMPLLSVSRLFEIVAAFQRRFELDNPMRIGAGLNTGLAIVGNLGSRASSDYTALGDTINKAFRLETASKQVNHDLVVGSSTLGVLNPCLQSCFQPCVVELKGYDQPEGAYVALAARLGSCISRSAKSASDTN
jgi:adenylate cyclase